MKFLIKMFAFIVLSLASVSVQAWSELIQNEEAIEGEPEVFFLGKSLNGSIRAQQCEKCPVEKFVITPETKAFDGEKEVQLSSKAGSSKKPQLILFNVKTKKVTRLYWYSQKLDDSEG